MNYRINENDSLPKTLKYTGLQKILLQVASLVLFLFIIVLFSTCRSAGSTSPTLEEKWVNVMMDMYTFQVVQENFEKEKKDSLSRVYKNQIITIHDITAESLDAFIEQLANDPDLAVKYYDEAIKRFDEMEQQLDEDHHTEQ